ncbi:MAG: polyphosphate kinase 2 [Rhizobiales bacterium 65-9]|nr:polyphosphate kinase 2 [Hyphomicrobiales bacterium]OJY37417.1 MAG: polyphosphate kinase 2 [Rhizobiales bacterium 65-9]
MADADRKEAKPERPEPPEGTLPFNIADPKLPKAISSQSFRSGGYPYEEKMDDDRYEKELLGLQIELVKLHNWIRDSGERLVILFEGRDGAGKGGAIKRFTEHLNPRVARVVALAKPTDVEKGQWYFQRYIAELPTRGEITLFDRSWYNRAGVERVMGFCTEAETDRFLAEAPDIEKMLVKNGVRLIKLFFSVGREMQLKRLHQRYHDPLKRWKLSPIDFAAPDKWDDYSNAFDAMLHATDTKNARWTIILANDKRRTRLNAIRHVLWTIPYPGRDESRIGDIDPRIVLSGRQFLEEGGEE